MPDSSVFITHSQNFKDVMLWRALKHVKKGFYIDVGAWLPETDSVTKAFYDRGWSGINIEPDPIAYAKLAMDRSRDINLQLAVSDSRGCADLHLIKNTGLSTLIDDIADMHLKAGHLNDRVSITIKTLNDIWEEYIHPDQDVHFLKIDVEGMEEAVLRGNDWLKHRPWVVVVEATLPSTQQETQATWEQILLSADYHFVYSDGLNRFYVADEHRELITAFKYPPNVFDNFKLSALDRSELQLNAERNRASQLENELHTVYSSRSWRITAPLRAGFDFACRAKATLSGMPHAFRRGIGAAIRPIMSGMVRFVTSHSSLKAMAAYVVQRCPLLEYWLYRFTVSYGLIESGWGEQGYSQVPAELSDLSPSARRIYLDLNRAIERTRRQS